MAVASSSRCISPVVWPISIAALQPLDQRCQVNLVDPAAFR